MPVLPTLGELLSGVTGAIAVDEAKPRLRDAAGRVNDGGADLDNRAGTVAGPAPAPLWSPVNTPLDELATIDRGQALLVRALLDEHASNLKRLIDELRQDVPVYRVEAAYFAVGDTVRNLSSPELDTGGGQWIMETLTAWTDPAAGADVLLDITTNLLGGVPFRITAPRTGVATVTLRMPAIGDSNLQVLASAGGGAGARAALLVTYKRG